MREEKEKLKGIKIYLFGSFSKIRSKDIDLLLVYDANIVPIHNILSMRRYLFNKFSNLFLILVDITVLSEEEEKELNFINYEAAVEIGL